MSDQETTEAVAPELSPEDAISRGKGMKLDQIAEDSPASKALDEFRTLVEQHKAAEAQAESLKLERNAMVRTLKDEHNIGFTAMAEIIGATSSLVLYLYERAAGKSAKQIREESQRSAAAKAQFRETDPNKAPARKQTPEEKQFRKQQREQLQAFLATQKEANPEITESEITSDEDE